ncbi:hypothetical protein [Lysobacter capsici]|uniref:hypothetical protein n=1 Tax=Lysobacter capsici TaxID=435897 RepID=UPI000A4153A1|nr:hypothetical protein [Lysobacter capsici]
MNRMFFAAAVLAALSLTAIAIARPPTAQTLPGQIADRVAPQHFTAAIPGVAASATTPSWSDTTTAAATGYCLAKHPYQTIHTGGYTPDGFEIVAAPGIVGAVRRNFIRQRRDTSVDQGINNSCPQACAQFGKLYGPSYVGASLRQKVAGGALINSGLGDLGALVMTDHDYYLGKTVVAGMWSRGNTWHESDVAQADYCCCQAKAPRLTLPLPR